MFMNSKKNAFWLKYNKTKTWKCSSLSITNQINTANSNICVRSSVLFDHYKLNT